MVQYGRPQALAPPQRSSPTSHQSAEPITQVRSSYSSAGLANPAENRLHPEPEPEVGAEWSHLPRPVDDLTQQTCPTQLGRRVGGFSFN